MTGLITAKHAWDGVMPVVWVCAVAVVVWSVRRTVDRDRAADAGRGRRTRWLLVGIAGCVLFAGFAVNVDLTLPHEHGGTWHWFLAALFAAGMGAAVIAATWLVWFDAAGDVTADPWV